MTHELKTYPEFFKEVWNFNKAFELRKDDRNFQIGDKLQLLEYDANTRKYSGRYCIMVVDYILRDHPGLEKGYCIMSVHFDNRNF